MTSVVRQVTFDTPMTTRDSIEAAVRLGAPSHKCMYCNSQWIVDRSVRRYSVNMAAHTPPHGQVTHVWWACSRGCAKNIADGFAHAHGDELIYAYVTDGYGSPVDYDVKPAYLQPRDP